jgi:hypothetical protein
VGHYIRSSGQRTTRMPESKLPQDLKRLMDVQAQFDSISS